VARLVRGGEKMNAVERNAPCPCGSGKKYKKCCMDRAPVPASIEGLLREALRCHEAGDLARAEAMYGQILRIRPDLAEIHYQLGLIAGVERRLNEAVDCYRKVLALKPDFPEALNNLGHAYNELRRWSDALPVLQKALALRPQYALAHNNLGITLDELGQPEEAMACFRRALAINPDFVEALHNLGTDLLIHGWLDEAIGCLQRAITLRPGHAVAHLSLGNARICQGDFPRAEESLRQAIALQPELAEAYHSRLFMRHYQPLPAMEIYQSHRAFAERFEGGRQSLWPVHRGVRDPAKRLKVGYVSPDLRQHSVAYFLEPVLTQHDRTQVEVYAYYNNTVEDAVTARLRREVDHWVPCKGMSDAELAARIQADGIDLLIDLAGHTVGNRLLVFARKPAPVQVSYLGYPATTGLQAMDWRLVTAETDPEGAEQWHSERLYRLPRSLWCYRPPATAGEVQGETPARTVGSITFGSMNNIAKVSDAAVATWSGILKRVPGSRLVLTNLPEGEGTAQVARRFAAQGIAEERLVLQGKLSAEAYEAQLQKIDLGLDPYPYNGTTTTCQSLWMGIPVITLEGETSVARSGYALLQTLGLEELIARDEGEYVEIATRLANDLDRLDALRSGMRSRFEASALRDETGFTREIEDAYRTMWRQWCATVEHV
jgi:predicted O-linked N-acetylglucosamine transferase (SPINDLY family)